MDRERPGEVPPVMPGSRSPGWLTSLELLGTTVTVMLVAGLVIWYESIGRGPRLALTIGAAAVFYVGGLVGAGLRSDPQRISCWPFLLAGAAAGVAELINAQFVVTRELLMAVVTGVVIGAAHWTALWIWIRLNTRRPA